jgi:hypothetical protein
MTVRVDKQRADEVWGQYLFYRDNGHTEFLKTADKTNNFVMGEQWDALAVARLDGENRPHLTINQTLPTISIMVGEHLNARSEITFRPRQDGHAGVAKILSKVLKHVYDDNKFDWIRRQVFEDGIINGRGFFDVRVDFKDNLMGEARITALNPKSVLLHPDAEDYNPDTWPGVITTKWMTPDEVGAIYGKDAAKHLAAAADTIYSAGAYSYDRVEQERDRFGSRNTVTRHDVPSGSGDATKGQRYVRVIEHQYRQLEDRSMFVNLANGDTRPVPDTWPEERVNAVAAQFGLVVIRMPGLRVRWVITAGDLVLHDEWSPYECLTIVPFFPYFRRGKSSGVVEQLIDPQVLLNKTDSQMLHVINSTANSGWIVSEGKLVNMTTEELAANGASTGLVVEVIGDVESGLKKITPNPFPTGLDRMSYKAEEAIKSISLVTDTMRGDDRADVAAKAIAAKQQRGAVPLKPVFHNLDFTEQFVVERVLKVIQTYYSEPRVMMITSDAEQQQHEMVAVNQVDPDTQEVLNDLTVGEYDVIMVAVPAREAHEDTQFDQAMAMREAGIPIDDAYIIKNSRLLDRADIIAAMEAAANSPEAQAQRNLQMRGAEAEVAKTEAEVGATNAKAKSDLVKANATITEQERKIAELEAKLRTDDPNVQAAITTNAAALEAMQSQERHAGEQQRAAENHSSKLRQAAESHALKLELQSKAAQTKPSSSKE